MDFDNRRNGMTLESNTRLWNWHRNKKPAHLSQYKTMKQAVWVNDFSLSIPVQDRESRIQWEKSEPWKQYQFSAAIWLARQAEGEKIQRCQNRFRWVFGSWIWQDVYWSRRFNPSAIMVIVIETLPFRINTKWIWYWAYLMQITNATHHKYRHQQQQASKASATRKFCTHTISHTTT